MRWRGTSSVTSPMKPWRRGRRRRGIGFSKFLRRNRGPVLAASLVLLALVGGIVGTTFGMIRRIEAGGRGEATRHRRGE